MPITTEFQARQRIIEIVKQFKTTLQPAEIVRYSGPNHPITNKLEIDVTELDTTDEEGQYLPAGLLGSSRPKINIKPAIADPDRRNFTFHHEVMHHLIREDGELYSFLNEHATGDDLEQMIDEYCNFGAAEFLVPSDGVRALIDREGFSVVHIERLEQEYPASKSAIAIQLAHCARHECYIFICEMGIPPHKHQTSTSAIAPFMSFDTRLEPFLHTSCVARSFSPKVRQYLPGRFVRIHADHLIAKSFRQRATLRGRDHIPFKSGTPWETECEAFYFKGKVYAAFNVSAPASAEQIALF